MRVNMHEAKTNLSELVAAVESGEASEVEIARAGQVVARWCPLHPVRLGRRAIGPGAFISRPDFDDLPESVTAAFFGAMSSEGSC